MPKLLEGLNDQQIPAVTHKDGPALVVAGPGSGKTRVLTHRIAWLILEQHIPEYNILCVTFTNKAAIEVNERIQHLLRQEGGIPIKLPWSGTFHSICSKILRREGKHIGIPPGFSIYDTADQLSLIKEICRDFGVNTKQINPNAVLGAISSAKSELVGPNDYTQYAQGYFQRTVAKIYPEYHKRLRANGALDFDDLLVEVVHLFQAHENVLEKYQNIFEYILVDEYQDTNRAQYELSRLLAQQKQNIFVVGDMSQAIYSFRGADYRNILNFQKDYPNAKIYNLERNYRSTQTILDAAKSVIKNNTSHIALDLWTDKAHNEKITIYTAYDDTDEIAFITNQILAENSRGKDWNEMAILYRTNAQSRALEEGLIKNNIPYRIFGGFKFYARKEIKDIISYLSVIQNPQDTVAWNRIINTPPRGIGKVAQNALQRSGWDLNEIEQKTGLPFFHWHSQRETLTTLELMDDVLEKTKYLNWLDDKTEENLARIENIKELRSVAVNFENLADFLENVALIESTDKPGDTNNALTLMTIHASKGLEFPTVFIAGMEEGLFPHSRSLLEKEELEEERRLCYVAITRAMTRLFLTHSKKRLYFGKTEMFMPSRFLEEIPEKLVDKKGEVKRNSYLANNMQKKFGDSTELDQFLADFESRKNFSWE